MLQVGIAYNQLFRRSGPAFRPALILLSLQVGSVSGRPSTSILISVQLPCTCLHAACQWNNTHELLGQQVMLDPWLQMKTTFVTLKVSVCDQAICTHATAACGEHAASLSTDWSPVFRPF